MTINLLTECSKNGNYVKWNKWRKHNKDLIKFSHNSCLDFCFSNFDLSNIIFEKCKIVGAVFDESKMLNTKFIDCCIRKTCFRRANLHFLDFQNCEISGSDFSYSFFKTVKFIQCGLFCCFYEYSNLNSILFSKSYLYTLYFKEAILNNCNFKDVILFNFYGKAKEAQINFEKIYFDMQKTNEALIINSDKNKTLLKKYFVSENKKEIQYLLEKS